MSSIHVVAKGDTLSGIAKRFGTTATELKTINHITNPNRLKIGQEIQLKKENVLGVQLLILDKDRNPIPDLHYFMEYAGKQVKGLTSVGGLSKPILTDTPEDLVRILIRRFDGSLKEIGSVVSGYGNKLVTLISPSIKVNAKTEKHPDMPKGHLPYKSEKPKPIHKHDANKTATTDKKDLGPKTTPTSTPDGKPLTQVEGDILDLDFIGGYTGESLTEEDYNAAAKEIGCEVEVIKAIERVESGGKTGFDSKNRPVILYERHIFSRNSKHSFDEAYPDISLKKGYKLKKKGDDVSADQQALNYYAAGSDANYKRLAKAYQLNNEAALKACSWGKFQVLGENYKDIGFSSVKEMVSDIAKGPKGHLKSFIGYIKSKKLQKAMQEKEWGKIAAGYNGKGYKTFHYDTRIEHEYEKLKG